MMMSIVRYAMGVMAGAMWLAPGRMAAQELAGAAVGDSVRIEAPALGPGIRGELVAMHGDTLYVRRYGAMLAVPMARVERVDVRRRLSPVAALGRGVAYGAPMGLAAGFLVGTTAHGGGNPDCADDCNQLPTVGAAAGLAVGTVLGALIGVSSPMGRWVRVSPRGGVALSLGVKP